MANLELQLDHLSRAEAREVRVVINGYVSDSVNRGLIPQAMVPLASEYIAARIEELRTASTHRNDSIQDSIELILRMAEPTTWTVFVPPQLESSLVSVETGRFLAGGPIARNILFQESSTLLRQEGGEHGTIQVSHSIGDFLSENSESVALEVAIEVLGLILILGGGPAAAKKSVEEVAQKAVKNKRILDALNELVETIMNAQGGDALRRALEKLVKALSDANIVEEALSTFVKGLTGWQIFLLILNLLLIFTPLGWGKKVAEILVWVGGITYHMHHKYETWAKGKEQTAAH